MRILLVGEYSNVHWTLAEGLRQLGHRVTVASDGDGWKNYRRDIDLRRRSLGLWDTARYLFRLHEVFPRLTGYDVVQLINPIFLDLKAERLWPYYERLRRENGRIVLGAFGMDHYWVKAACDEHTFRYSDFQTGGTLRHTPENDALRADWTGTEKERLNRYVAETADGIVAGLYEYDVAYRPDFGSKLRFIPYPVRRNPALEPSEKVPRKVKFFIGIQRHRSRYKGTDVMLRALERLAVNYPKRIEVRRVENVPFETYQTLLDESDVLLDQLYSYTPAMNGLLAMSHGLVLVGGGEPEHYDLLGENELRPIVNVLPSEEDVYEKLEQLVLHPERIPELKRQSVEYIRRHHDYLKVARQYAEFYQTL